MNADEEMESILNKDASGGAKEASRVDPQKAALLAWLETEESDRADRSKLSAERLRGMQQMRNIRNIAFKWVMLPLLALSSLAVFALGIAVACYDFVGTSPTSEYAGGLPSPWPKVVFISGTFLMFILVFGAFVKGVFASWRDKGDDGPDAFSRRDAFDFLVKIFGGSGGS